MFREATELLKEYFTPGTNFDPPCSLLSPGPKRIIELGSGQSVASLHLANALTEKDVLILTDLPEVMPLCEARARQSSIMVAYPLAWGSSSAHLAAYRSFTHIIMCDLVRPGRYRADQTYFPHLYPSLLYTLLDLTQVDDVSDSPTFGPEVILACK